MTAPIDIECPACASTAGNYCTSVTTDPKLCQRVTFYHAERIDAAFRQLDETQDARMLAAYIGGANDANEGVKCKRVTFEEWKTRDEARLNEIARRYDDPRALREALREALERLEKHESTEDADILSVPFTRMELAITITSLRERFPGSSKTADRLEHILHAAQSAGRVAVGEAEPIQDALTADDLSFIITTREVFKL